MTDVAEPQTGSFLASKIEPSKVVDLIASKQTQYYALWAVYTAVQFAAASFGLSQHALPWGVGLAVLAGFWMFNIGHLGFVVECLIQIDNFRAALDAADEAPSAESTKRYQAAVQYALRNTQEARLFWRRPPPTTRRKVYIGNILVHLFIDVCASIALFVRLSSS